MYTHQIDVSVYVSVLSALWNIEHTNYI